MRRPAALALLLLPTLLLAGWTGLLARRDASLEGIRVALEGVDPRDLLRGHYLTARLDVRTAGGEEGPPAGCACLEPGPPDPLRPLARPVESCTPAPPQCRWPVADLATPFRIYIPQERAEEYERRLRERDGTLSVLVKPRGDGTFLVGGLEVTP
ncbi:MAG TPA: hypothetical protein VEB20_00255 [Azospirillaceae bacterium]|nr:hypothetical protein [Azospirillaceae bacterium]